MAHFLKGKYKGFYAAGNSQCVKDIFRFRQSAEGRVVMEVTRRDLESTFGRYWMYQNATINLIPLDESKPRQGGKVHVKGYSFDFRTLTPQTINQYGIYSDDFVTFGTFSKDAGNPLDNEEVLLKIVDEHNTFNNEVVDKTTFRFDNNEVTFEREVNPELSDTEINHAVGSTRLDVVQNESWTETLFYGIGNKSV